MMKNLFHQTQKEECHLQVDDVDDENDNLEDIKELEDYHFEQEQPYQELESLLKKHKTNLDDLIEDIIQLLINDKCFFEYVIDKIKNKDNNKKNNISYNNDSFSENDIEALYNIIESDVLAVNEFYAKKDPGVSKSAQIKNTENNNQDNQNNYQQKTRKRKKRRKLVNITRFG